MTSPAPAHPTVANPTITVDAAKCIAAKGCRVCIDVCPLDILVLDEAGATVRMAYDECWYCLPCEHDCPTKALKVEIPYLLR